MCVYGALEYRAGVTTTSECNQNRGRPGLEHKVLFNSNEQQTVPPPRHQFQTWLFELNNGLDGGHALMSISVFNSFNNFVLIVSESLNDSASKLIACQMRRDNE